MHRNYSAALALILVAILFLAINVLSNATLHSARFDLTEDRLYTLSAGTQSVLDKLAEPVSLKLYYSERLASQISGAPVYGQRVRDMLKEFESRAGGNLVLEIIDPEPFSETEDSATSLGMAGVPTAAGDKFYLGLAAFNMLDGQEVIPFFAQDREQFLEYDITRLIAKLSGAKKPRVGVLSGLPLDMGKGGIEAVMRGEINPFVLFTQIREQYDIQMLTQQFTAIGDEIDLLMIVQPRPMDPLTSYAIDQFVLRGGRVIAFTDPVSEVAKPPAQTKNPLASPDAISPPSSLPELYKAWGVAMDPNQIVGDRKLAQRVTVEYLDEQQDVAYVGWIGMRGPAFNRNDPVTGDLQLVNLAMAGHLQRLDGASTSMIPLISSSDDAALIAVTPMLRRVPNPIEMLRAFQPSGEQYVLAARITGPASSAFTDKPPLPKDASPELTDAYKSMPPHLAGSQQPVNLILVADSDLWEDRWWVDVADVRGQRMAVPHADNANFVMAAIENMTGAGELISLRSRARETRPFMVVQDILRRAEARYLAEEQRLEAELDATQRRLANMERPSAGAPKPDGGAGEVFLTPEQEAEIKRARAQISGTRTALRNVQHSLRQDVDQLGATLRFVNIALVPIAVMALGLGLSRWRLWRRKARAIGVTSAEAAP